MVGIDTPVTHIVYNDGISTMQRMATTYGAEIGIDDGAMIGALLLILAIITLLVVPVAVRAVIVLALDGADASYDVVLGLNVLHLVEDRRGALATVARLLKPGGAFVSSTVCLGGSFLRMIRWLVPLGKAIGMMPDVYVLTEAEFAEEVRDAGFTIEDQWHHGKNGLAVFMVALKP